jgi:hypothetical protein
MVLQIPTKLLCSEGFLCLRKLAETPVAGLGLRHAKTATLSRSTIFRRKKLMVFFSNREIPNGCYLTALM